MYPDQPTGNSNSWFTPKVLIITGAIIILLTIVGNFIYNAYIQNQQDSQEQSSADLDPPINESTEIDPDSFTFRSEDQKYSIDYPKTVSINELDSKYYKNTGRLFEGNTELVSTKKTSDPQYFKIIITAQITYRDDQDKEELLLNVLNGQRFCNTKAYKTTSHTNRIINDITYTVRQNIRNCEKAAYTTFYEGFSRLGTYVIRIQSNQSFDKIKSTVDEILTTLYLDSQ